MPDRFSRRGHVEHHARERGATLILFTLMLATVVLPLIGLAIDGGLAYLAQGRLTAAADAAALAGARSLNVGMTIQSQMANATNLAQQYFKANFPPGLLNSSNAKSSVTITPPSDSSDHKILVQVQSSADIQLSFLGMFGHPTATISAGATTSRRDANVVLALDRSGSMAGVCEVMKSDAESFVMKFVNGRDSVGLVTFMGNAKVDQASTKQFKPVITDTLAKLQCGGNTGSAAALSLAHWQILQAAEPGALNVIVFFTDGVPNGFTAGPAADKMPNGFPLKTGKTCKDATTTVATGYIANGGGIYDAAAQPINSTATPILSNCPSGSFGQLAQAYQFIPESDAYGNSASSAGYAPVKGDGTNHIELSSANSDAVSINAADYAARQIRQDGIVIYVIGLDGNGGVDSRFLQNVANVPSSPSYVPSQPTGKYYYSPNAGQLGSAFSSVASEILRISR